MVGSQEDFEYDTFAELVFDDKAAFQAFYTLMSQEEPAEKLAKDEELFMERGKLKVVIVDDCIVTDRQGSRK